MNKRILLTTLLFVGVSTVLQAFPTNYTWNFSFTPAQSVVVYYYYQFSPIAGQVNVPGTSGEIPNVPVGDIATLDFTPDPGYTITSISENGKVLTGLFTETNTNTGSVTYAGTFNTTNNDSFVIKAVKGTPTPTPTPVPDPTGTNNFTVPGTNGAVSTPVSTFAGTYSGPIGVNYGHDSDTNTWLAKTVIALGLAGPGRPQGECVAACDDEGKLMFMGTLSGNQFTKGVINLTGTGAISTVNGLPTTSIITSATGTIAGVPARLNANFGLTAGPTFSTTTSILGSVMGVPVNVSNIKGEIRADGIPAAVSSEGWRFNLAISKGITVNTAKTTYASTLLSLPTGDYIFFAQKAVKYSAKKGYTIIFANGVLSDSSGTPILNNKNKPTVVKKTSLIFSGLTFSHSGNAWTPAGGTINYKFMGQKGAAPLKPLLTTSN